MLHLSRFFIRNKIYFKFIFYLLISIIILIKMKQFNSRNNFQNHENESVILKKVSFFLNFNLKTI